MKFSKIEFAVGCFIVAAIFCGVMLALKVAGLSFDFKDDSYRVYGYFECRLIKITSPREDWRCGYRQSFRNSCRS